MKNNEKIIFDEAKIFLGYLRREYRERGPQTKADSKNEMKEDIWNHYYRMKYKPFDGHVSKLAHCYRHLFQTVKFVVEQKELNEKEKLGYLKTIRAQLSNHEQLMLYYNGLAMANAVWLEKEYFTRYKMIHNLPLPLADFGITPQEHPKIKEWYDKGNEDVFELE